MTEYTCKICRTEVYTDEPHRSGLCYSCRRNHCWLQGNHEWAVTLTRKTWCTYCDVSFNKEQHGDHGEYHNRSKQQREDDDEFTRF